MLPRYLNDTVKKRAERKEKKFYKHLCSGAFEFKGDFSDKDSLIEYKAPKRKSFAITEKMLEKIFDESLEMGKENPIFIIEFKKFVLVGKVVKKSRGD